ncbi:hypothetical protein G4B88_029897 [Cannabis sativa]|uniref:DUF599 domain-containing protein n=1 Tax=Cannabis sativa TaxID=3483 RepID=A0A7J6DMW0_CANSA|nr:hypothetical protein G4B88_029897 [Cannabis sativa]
MEKKAIDYMLVPLGLFAMVTYHAWLLYRVIYHPTKTIIGVNAIHRHSWTRAMMENLHNNGVVSVQSMRNNILSSTLMATVAITLSSLIAVLMTNYDGKAKIELFVFGNKSEASLSVKYFCIMASFLVAFLFNLQSTSYYSNATTLINMPYKRLSEDDEHEQLLVDFVANNVIMGGYFFSLGLRAFYIAFALFLWIFGPLPMFIYSFVLVFMLYFLDISFHCEGIVDVSDEDISIKLRKMEKRVIDYLLIPLGLLAMVLYHCWLLHRVRHHPTKTVIGVNAMYRRFWVRNMMENVTKYGMVSVETLRNNMMASTLLATVAIMLCSVIAILMTTGTGESTHELFVMGNKSEASLSVKYFCIMTSFLLAFLFNIQSIRYLNQASILINVPYKKKSRDDQHQQVTVDFVDKNPNVNLLPFSSLCGLKPNFISTKHKHNSTTQSKQIEYFKKKKKKNGEKGILGMVVYHGWLLYRVIYHPTKTVIGVNAIHRRYWVRAMMEDVSKNGVLAVQTLRNNIMASTLLASTAIMLSSLIAVLMTNGGRNKTDLFVFGDRSEASFSLKYFCILACFLVAFLFNVQSIRYFSHASILINVPYKKISRDHQQHQHLTVDFVAKNVNRGSFFWSLGLRAFYFSFPLFLWIFGPLPMFISSFVLIFMLYFLDVTFECGWVVDVSNNDIITYYSKDEELGRPN